MHFRTGLEFTVLCIEYRYIQYMFEVLSISSISGVTRICARGGGGRGGGGARAMSPFIVHSLDSSIKYEKTNNPYIPLTGKRLSIYK
jgi:hypothetical protein